MILDAKALDAVRFTPEQCDAVFTAVLHDDDVDAPAKLPDRIELDYSDGELIDCFRICRQLWKTGVDRDVLIALIAKLARDGNLGAEDRLLFKHARARFKHLRFAYALYGADHRYPVIFDWVTVSMGHLQDALKNRQRGAISRQAVLARFFLNRFPQYMLRREVDRFKPSSGAVFRAYVERQVATLRTVVAQDLVTGGEFHATRKIISRQGSFYNSLGVLRPSAETHGMSMSLSAINGLMGRMHDELVERRILGTQDYHRERFLLPEGIRQRLITLLDRYPA